MMLIPRILCNTLYSGYRYALIITRNVLQNGYCNIIIVYTDSSTHVNYSM
jgi:hypothetical protein